MSVGERESSRIEFTTIEFVGELNIRNAPDVHARLIEAIAGSDAIEAAVAADAVPDLTFLQLIASARRTAREAGVSFRLSRPAQGPLLEALERGGFLAAPADREFWLRQEELR